MNRIDPDAYYFILPIAFELRRGQLTDAVKCGPETAAACEKALAIAWKIRSTSDNAELVMTAGHVGNGWNVVMADVMAQHARTRDNGHVRITSSPAPVFNTEGELRQLLAYIGKETMQYRPEIIVVVKNWHAPRVWMLLQLMSWESSRVGRYMPNWTIVTIPSKVPYRHRMRELIAIPENFFRIVWKNLRSRR